MPNRMNALATLYRFNTGAMQTLAAKFEGDDWLRRMAPQTSTPYWILGHLATYRRVILGSIAGQAVSPPWGGLFMRDTQSPAQLDPAPADVLADFAAAGESLAARMVELTDAQLAADCGRPVRSGDRTVEGLLHFIQFHESYHIGQIGLIAKALGKDPLVTPGG